MHQDQSDDRHTPAVNQTLPNVSERWQTRQRGSNDDEYQIYVAAAKDLGWDIKSYNEWLRS